MKLLTFRKMRPLALSLAMLAPAVTAAPSAEAADFTAAVSASDCPTEEKVVAPVSGDPSILLQSADYVGPGDKVKLAVYEMLQSQDDKWGAERQRLQAPAKGFQLRAEMSNEYLVQEDGTLSLPILGTFDVHGKRPVELQSQLECSFEKMVGRKGFVNVLGVVKQPIYVVGPVKKSGSFEYTPGLTVLHAVALAGGVDRTAIEPWKVAEVTREAERLQLALDQAMRMIARTTVLQSEKTGQTTRTPNELAELAGKERASVLIGEEQAARKLALLSLHNEETALKAAVDTATSEVNARQSHFELLQNSIGLRRERANNLADLAGKGALGRPVLLQAQAELADVEDRLQEAQSQLRASQERLDKARQDLERHKIEADIAYQRQLLDSRIEARRAAMESDGAASVARSLVHAQTAEPGPDDIEYKIIRRLKGDVQTITAEETTLLRPGDLVQLIVKGRALSSPSAQN
jgi:protein involved in polysaccharide export with SLBB domain